jgi:hypothetical protein
MPTSLPSSRIFDAAFNRHVNSEIALDVVELSQGNIAVGFGGKCPNLLSSATTRNKLISVSFIAHGTNNTFFP